MGLDDWIKEDDRSVRVYPLVGYEALVAHGVLCALKIRYLDSPAQMLGGESSSVPLIISPELARELGQALIKIADEATRGPTSIGFGELLQS